MILADTSVWVDHLRRNNGTLASLLDRGDVACHPFVVGEIALGRLQNRRAILELLGELPTCRVAEDAEVLALIERRSLVGTGIGWVDAHLLAAALIDGRLLWTLDRRLMSVARDLGATWDGR